MSDVDPTPGTPVTVGDRLSWFRSDMAARLEQLRGTPAADLAQVLAETVLLRQATETGLDQLAIDVLSLRGVPETTLRDLWTKLSIIEGALDQTLPTIVSRLGDVQDRLDNIQAALGAEPYGSLEVASVRGLLSAMLNSQGNIGISPDGTAPDASSSITQTLNGRRYVVWPNPIEGLIRSNSNIELTPEDTWNGYELYVQSSAETFQSGAGNGAEFPTNSWLTTALDGTIAISVESNYSVRAFFRLPNIVEYPAYSFSTAGGENFALWAAPLTMGSFPTNPAAGSVYVTTNLDGWTLINRGTNAIEYAYWLGTSLVGYANLGAGLEHTITSDTSYMYVYLRGNAPNTAVLRPPQGPS